MKRRAQAELSKKKPPRLFIVPSKRGMKERRLLSNEFRLRLHFSLARMQHGKYIHTALGIKSSTLRDFWRASP
jgi:hypothetical protein